MNKVLKSITKIRQLGVPQKAMSMLFDCSTDNIELHLKNIFASWKLEKDSVTEIFSVTESNGKKYLTQFYKRQAKYLPNKQKNMLKRGLKGIVSYKIAYSKVTLIGLWTLFLLKKILTNKYMTICTLPFLNLATFGQMVLILDSTRYPNGYGYAKIRIQHPKCYD